MPATPTAKIKDKNIHFLWPQINGNTTFTTLFEEGSEDFAFEFFSMLGDAGIRKSGYHRVL